MPYVVCDAETFDDEILVYFTEEDVEEKAKDLIREGNQVQVVAVDKASRLAFFTGLYPIGVNCIRVNAGVKGETAVQLNSLITRPDAEKLPNGGIRVENPELHLTALYFLQQVRRRQGAEETEAIKELNEEMMAHFQKGTYILPIEEGKGVPILKQKDGKIFQPIFTDIYEMKKFQMFSKGAVFKTGVVPAAKLPEVLAPGAAGVAVNPLGINLPLQIERKEKK